MVRHPLQGTLSTRFSQNRIHGQAVLISLQNTVASCGPWHSHGTSSGALAQLGERLHGMQEVSGSIPLGSTIANMIDLRFIRRNAGRRGFVRRRFSHDGLGFTLIGEVSPIGVFGVIRRP